MARAEDATRGFIEKLLISENARRFHDRFRGWHTMNIRHQYRHASICRRTDPAQG
jgi:hypothetical protein